MATYVLIHGAQATSWYWHLVVPELERLGHEAIAVDLPSDDERAGLRRYTDAALSAIGDPPGRDLIVVGQSLGGFTAPLVCEAVPVRLLVLVNAMVPRPGETAGAWWGDTGHVFPEDFDPVIHFLHDVPAPVAEESAQHLREVTDAIFTDPWPLTQWPNVPTAYVLCRVSRRPVLHRRLPATHGAGATRHHPPRDGRRACFGSLAPRRTGPGPRGAAVGKRETVRLTQSSSDERLRLRQGQAP